MKNKNQAPNSNHQCQAKRIKLITILEPDQVPVPVLVDLAQEAAWADLDLGVVQVDLNLLQDQPGQNLPRIKRVQVTRV